MTNRIEIIISLSFITVIIFVVYKSTNDNVVRLKQFKKVAIADVTGVDIVLKGDGLFVSYEFIVNNKVVKNKKRVFVESKYLKKVSNILLHKHMPVIYDTIDINNNQLLINKDDYSMFGQIMPDSIKRIVFAIDSIKF